MGSLDKLVKLKTNQNLKTNAEFFGENKQGSDIISIVTMMS